MLPSELEELIERAAREEWEKLDLSGKGIEVLPATIGHCTSLKKLVLWDNRLSEIPDSITRLTNLQSLDLSHNGFNTIPDSITRLTNLQSLDLISNSLSEIPDSITRLTNLQFLDLSYNSLSEIPDSITRLTNLQSLRLIYNSLSEIPDSITRLTNLQFLDLSYNSLSAIPDSITKLTNLRSLSLSNNQIVEIPKEIMHLTMLNLLSLTTNQIKEIPESISQLSNLETLGLAGNRITEIPEVIIRLTNLCFLYLGSNQITKIPETISSFINLQFLDLNFNQITEIPKTISRLMNLQSLELMYNQVKKIPEEITKLPNLSVLSLLGNPIAEPPLEVVKEGIEAIRQYFQQLEAEGIDYLYEAKLLIVGEGGAGKTSLANKIINPDYQLCEEDSTKGIEVLHWSFPRSDGNQFNVNIWDFGGQEIYHSTHQYFLTKRSLYLLVTDDRKQDVDFYYWLNVIELLSDNSPVLIIKNEKQKHKKEVPSNLRSEFRNLKDDIATDLADNRNLKEILRACEYYITQLPHIGQALPKTWVKVRLALESDSRNFITLDEYLQICRDNGFKERKDALQLSDYLHDLGICLHFQDDKLSSLYKTIILKPKWGTEAAYAVLKEPKVENNFGHFTNKDLDQIWSSAEYAEMQGELLELMKKFQLCYEIPQEEGSYIAPQLLTENQPKYIWDESENLILRYTYDFMPKGMLRQLIVTMHEHIDKDQTQDQANNQIVWRSGVIINCKNITNTRAEVIENYGKREIKIRVSGKNRRDLLTVVTHELDKIHNSYKRLADKYQKLIPCNCNTCKGSQNPHFYEFANLKRRYENRKYTVECDISYEDVNVLSLIDDVGEKSNLYARDEDKQYNREQNNPFPVNVNITNTFNPEQNMSNSQPSSSFNAPVGQVIIGTQTVAGDNIGILNNYSPNLAQAAKEIKELLDQLSEEYNPNTEKGQNLIKDEAVKVIKNDSTLQQKIVNALKEGGVTALEEAINHPVAKIVIATTKGFLEG